MAYEWKGSGGRPFTTDLKADWDKENVFCNSVLVSYLLVVIGFWCAECLLSLHSTVGEWYLPGTGVSVSRLARAAEATSPNTAMARVFRVNISVIPLGIMCNWICRARRVPEAMPWCVPDDGDSVLMSSAKVSTHRKKCVPFA